MSTFNFSTYKHPNAYLWPENEIKNSQSVDRAIHEMRIQIAALNKRVEQLSKEVNSFESKQQLETLKNTYYNI